MTGRVRVLWLFAVAVVLALTSACGQKSNCSGITFGATGGSTGSSSGGTSTASTVCGSNGSGSGGATGAIDYLYSVNATLIDGAYFNGTSLAAIPNFVAPDLGAGGAADMIIVGGKFLYQPWAPASGGDQVVGFAIDHANGLLAPLAGSPFSVTAIGDSLATDPNGKFLFLGQSATQTISVMQVNSSTGALTPAPGSPFALGDVPTHLTVDGSGKFLYVNTSVGSGIVFGFSIDQTTGALTSVPGNPFIEFVTRLAAHPTGNYLIGAGGGTVYTIPIDTTTGALLTSTPFTPPNSVNQVLIHPSGNFAYGFSQPVNGIQAFSLDSSGNLTALAGSPFASITPINAAKMDEKGTAMVGLTAGGQFFVVVIDPKTGALTAPSASAYTGTASPFFGFTN